MAQANADKHPVIIIGTGPVGIAVASELTRLDPEKKIVMFGGEPWRPYDRIQLSSLVAGNASLADLDFPHRYDYGTNVVHYQNRWVKSVDATSRFVTDRKDQVHRYSKLVLATGSSPLVPDIPGVDLPGVFTFRNVGDAMHLMARQTSSRRTVVIGGGLLGLEAAKAMQRHNTQVWVVERSDRLMPQQLDVDAAEFLRDNILAEGIQVSLNATVAAIEGNNKVERVWLEDGSELYCDTVIVAAGIRPNTELASDADIYVNRGICVGDDIRTSDPNIFAVGECAEHNGIVYGLVAPGLEQAAVAAQAIHGQSASYVGTIAAAKLKVFDTDVYGLGDAQDLESGDRRYVWRSSKDCIYRKLIVRDGRVVGVVSIGKWAALPRAKDFVNQQRQVTRKHVECFQRTGHLDAATD